MILNKVLFHLVLLYLSSEPTLALFDFERTLITIIVNTCVYLIFHVKMVAVKKVFIDQSLQDFSDCFWDC